MPFSEEIFKPGELNNYLILKKINFYYHFY